MRKALAIAAAVTLFCFANGTVRADAPPEATGARWMQTLLPLQNDGWENIAVAGSPFVVYISFKWAVHDEDRIVVPVRSEWMDPQEQPPTRIGKFLSLISRVEFNCKTMTYRHLAETQYAGRNLTGEASSADAAELNTWTNVFPQPVAESILAVVCSRGGTKSTAPSK
jgi:hypothetical protein